MESDLADANVQRKLLSLQLLLDSGAHYIMHRLGHVCMASQSHALCHTSAGCSLILSIECRTHDRFGPLTRGAPLRVVYAAENEDEEDDDEDED